MMPKISSVAPMPSFAVEPHAVGLVGIVMGRRHRLLQPHYYRSLQMCCRHRSPWPPRGAVVKWEALADMGNYFLMLGTCDSAGFRFVFLENIHALWFITATVKLV